MKRWLVYPALALPFLALLFGIGRNQMALSAAEEWRIPIAGYDPRDALRGRYIQFAYGWRLEGDVALCQQPSSCRLCLSQAGDEVVAAIKPADAQCAAMVDPAVSGLQFRHGFGLGSSFTGRIFVSEASAPEMEERLRAGPMQMVTALTPEGRLVTRRIEPVRP